MINRQRFWINNPNVGCPFNIPNEMMQGTVDEISLMVTKYLLQVDGETALQLWFTLKKSKDKINNYRPISLISNAKSKTKFLQHFAETNFRKTSVKKQSIEQSKFRQNFDGIHHI